MKKVLVTGGLGFIGSNLIKLLLKKNYYVINLDKVSYSSNKYNVKEYDNNKNYKFIKLDINSKKLTKIFKRYKPIGVFNLAAETHVDRSIDNPLNFIKSNILGTFNLLESFRRFYKSYSNTKLIHISTDEVFGDVLTGRSNENFKYKPSSPYAASKASSDHLVSSYVRTFKIPAIITNCSNNYGPCQHPEKLIPKLIYNIMNNRELPIYGNGKNIRDWIYVGEHVDRLIDLQMSSAKNDTYLIGGNNELSNVEIIKEIVSIIHPSGQWNPGEYIAFVDDRKGHDMRYAIDDTKMRNFLGKADKESLVISFRVR